MKKAGSVKVLLKLNVKLGQQGQLSILSIPASILNTAACNTKHSISMILRKNRGLWTVYLYIWSITDSITNLWSPNILRELK